MRLEREELRPERGDFGGRETSGEEAVEALRRGVGGGVGRTVGIGDWSSRGIGVGGRRPGGGESEGSFGSESSGSEGRGEGAVDVDFRLLVIGTGRRCAGVGGGGWREGRQAEGTARGVLVLGRTTPEWISRMVELRRLAGRWGRMSWFRTGGVVVEGLAMWRGRSGREVGNRIMMWRAGEVVGVADMAD